MRLSLRTVVPAALATAALVACGNSSATYTGLHASESATSTPATAAELVGEWDVTSVAARGSAPVRTPGDVSITFRPGRSVGGSDAVNDWSGFYSVQGNGVHIHQMISTAVGLTSNAPVARRESQAAIQALTNGRAAEISVTGSAMTIRAAGYVMTAERHR